MSNVIPNTYIKIQTKYSPVYKGEYKMEAKLMILVFPKNILENPELLNKCHVPRISLFFQTAD